MPHPHYAALPRGPRSMAMALAALALAAGAAFADLHVMDLRLARSSPEALAATVAQELSATLPYVAPAGSGHPSLVRVLNDSAQANTVQVTGYDDSGRRFGPEPVSLAAHEAATLTTTDLEQGGRGFAGLGDGEGWWRLEPDGQRPFRAGMYYRTADGFLAELTRPVAGRQEGTD